MTSACSCQLPLAYLPSGPANWCPATPVDRSILFTRSFCYAHALLFLTATVFFSPSPADYIFASVWGHKVYTIYSILFIVFIILIIVTAFITIALTYFQLAVEDHRWAG